MDHNVDQLLDRQAAFRLGCLSAALGIIFGAFGAHKLKRTIPDPERLKNWDTAAHYQLLNSIGLVAAGLAPKFSPVAATLFAAGISLFSGSLYILVLTNKKWLGMITPFGGTALIAGWILLALRGV